ncbi:unnamed protein product, partial [Allacma fusca]
MEMLMSIETVVRSRRTGENLPLSFYPESQPWYLHSI